MKKNKEGEGGANPPRKGEMDIFYLFCLFVHVFVRYTKLRNTNLFCDTPKGHINFCLFCLLGILSGGFSAKDKSR